MESHYLQKNTLSKELALIGEELSKKLKETFESNLIAVLFYGSRVRGDNFPESDLDILVVLNEFDESKMARVVSSICGELTRKFFIKVSPYVISEQDFEFGCRNLFPLNLGVFLSYKTVYGEQFVESCHQFINEAIQTGKLRVYPRSGIFIQR